MKKRMADISPGVKARIAGGFYLVTFTAGTLALILRGSAGVAAGLIAGATYVAVTLLFYDLFKPVSRGLSLLAAVVSLAGIAVGPLQLKGVHPLVFFGFYCLLLAYLIFRSAFLPRILSVGLVLAACGWLTFLSPPLANQLFPYNIVPGMLGEGLLTLWLLAAGVNVERWNEQAATPRTWFGTPASLTL